MSQVNDNRDDGQSQHGFGLNEETMRVIREVMRDDVEHGGERVATHQTAKKTQRRGLFSKLKLPQFAPDMITPRRVAIVVIMVAVFLKPWFLPTVLLWVALFVAFFLLVFGRDRCGRGLTKVWRFYSARRPERADQIRVRIDARLSRLQDRLERLPLRSRVDLPRWHGKDNDLAADHAYANRMDRIAHERQSKPYAG